MTFNGQQMEEPLRKTWQEEQAEIRDDSELDIRYRFDDEEIIMVALDAGLENKIAEYLKDVYDEALVEQRMKELEKRS